MQQDLEFLKNEMNADAKAEFALGPIDPYAAYQASADLWNSSLTTDAEILQRVGLIEAGRSVKQLYKSKKKNGKTVQAEDGKDGVLIPKTLVQQYLFKDELEQLKSARNQVSDAEGEISQLLEDGKSNPDFDGILFDDGDLMSKKDRVKLKDLDKIADADAIDWLKSYDNSDKIKREASKKVKELDSELEKKAVGSYETLTDDQIGNMLRIKWFAGLDDKIMYLLNRKIDDELARIAKLKDRYSETLSDIQASKEKIEAEFMELASQLVAGDSNDK